MVTYRGYLLDLDGTMYNGTKPISTAVEFVHRLYEQNESYVFVTNNSSKTPEQVTKKLQDMGVPVSEDQIVTSSLATAAYIKEKYGQTRCYVIGEEGLKYALKKQGHIVIEKDESVEAVVIGMDRSVTYEEFAKACLLVRAGAAFISTNGDIAIPTERGMLPGNGALTSVIEVSTGIKPIYIGKPEKTIMKEALKRTGTAKEETIMIGDNYDTDILAGMNTGIDTLLVLSGVTVRGQLDEVEKHPTHVMEDLSNWCI